MAPKGKSSGKGGKVLLASSIWYCGFLMVTILWNCYFIKYLPSLSSYGFGAT